MKMDASLVCIDAIFESIAGGINLETDDINQWYVLRDELVRTMCGTEIHWNAVSPPTNEWTKQQFDSLPKKDRSRHILTLLDSWSEDYGLTAGYQTNGQLMGHVVSFLILCLANYCTWHKSMEDRFHKEFKFFEIQDMVRVNGDDILFTADDLLYRLWTDRLIDTNFVPSPGKNIRSNDWMMINSQLIRVKRWITGDAEGSLLGGTCDTVQLQEIGYVNFGILTGRKKNDCSRELATIDLTHPLKDMKKGQTCDEWLNRVSSLSKFYQDMFSRIENPAARSGVLAVANKHYIGLCRGLGLHTVPTLAFMNEEVRCEPNILTHSVVETMFDSYNRSEFTSCDREDNLGEIVFRSFFSRITKKDDPYGLIRQLAPQYSSLRLLDEALLSEDVQRNVRRVNRANFANILVSEFERLLEAGTLARQPLTKGGIIYDADHIYHGENSLRRRVIDIMNT
jgi:hypothetical protein